MSNLRRFTTILWSLGIVVSVIAAVFAQITLSRVLAIAATFLCIAALVIFRRDIPSGAAGSPWAKILSHELAKPPIIVDAYGDIGLYSSLDEAAAQLEPVDAESDDVHAFDSAGRRIILRQHGKLVRMEVDWSVPADPDSLAMRLHVYIQTIGVDEMGASADLQGNTLDEMIALLWAHTRGRKGP